MAVSGVAARAAPGAIGFDWDARLSAAQAKQFYAKNYRFCIRYVSRDDKSRAANNKGTTPDLSADEAADILASGLALMVVQHVQQPGWTPTAALGASYGENAGNYASEGGLLAGTNLWLDLEGIKPGTPSSDIIDYCNGWFAAVTTAGYVPGIYVGFDVWLSPDELFFDLRTQHYWRAGGVVTDVSHRGYQMIQNISKARSPEDRDVTQTDALGGAVIWHAPA